MNRQEKIDRIMKIIIDDRNGTGDITQARRLATKLIDSIEIDKKHILKIIRDYGADMFNAGMNDDADNLDFYEEEMIQDLTSDCIKVEKENA